MEISNTLKEEGLGIILYDCYRPTTSQEKLWRAYPDRRFVAPPDKGSMHSRGVAIDMTLSDLDGKALNMGTPYDHFGKESAPDFFFEDDGVRKNRNVLKKIMNVNGFTQARSEWWHFSYNDAKFPLDSWEWPCEH